MAKVPPDHRSLPHCLNRSLLMLFEPTTILAGEFIEYP